MAKALDIMSPTCFDQSHNETGDEDDDENISCNDDGNDNDDGHNAEDNNADGNVGH